MNRLNHRDLIERSTPGPSIEYFKDTMASERASQKGFWRLGAALRRERSAAGRRIHPATIPYQTRPVAADAPWGERGKCADELIQALKKVWTTDPVEFHGKYYRIPKSVIGPKPVQKPHPPIYMAA